MPTPQSIKLGDRTLPRIGLGTNRLRNTDTGVSFVRAAAAAGVGMIDTAHLYTDGESEQTIGRALSEADRCIVATKGGYGGAGQGRPQVLHRQIDQSLVSLRHDRITLYYLHRIDPETPLEVSLEAIKERVDRGHIEHVGLSEVTVADIEAARRVLPIAAVQNNYSLAERKHDAVVNYCAEAGIVFVPFFPLRGADAPHVRAIAKRHGVATQQIALAWLLRRSPAIFPIPGTLSIDHLRQNLQAAAITLSDDEFETLAAPQRGSE